MMCLKSRRKKIWWIHGGELESGYENEGKFIRIHGSVSQDHPPSPPVKNIDHFYNLQRLSALIRRALNMEISGYVCTSLTIPPRLFRNR